MKVHVAVTKDQALNAAEILRMQAGRMSGGSEETAIIGIEVHDTLPQQALLQEATDVAARFGKGPKAPLGGVPHQVMVEPHTGMG